MYTQPSVPRSIGGVLDDTLQLYKASFSSCWTPSLAIGLLALGWELSFAPRVPVYMRPQASLAQLAAAAIPAHMALYLLVLAPLTLLAYLMVTASVIAAVRGERLRIGAALRIGLRRWFGALLATILFALAVVGPGILAGIVGGLAGSGPVGVFLFVAPMVIVAIYLWGRLQLYLVALLAEQAGPAASLGISWRLIGGHWWRASTIFGVLVIIVWVLSVLSGMVVAALILIGRPGAAAVLITTQIIGTVVRVFTLPLVPTALVAIYGDLKLRKEGSDLEARLGTLPQT